MKMKFLFKLVALMTIISVVGCSDDVGVGPKGKLYFSDSNLCIYNRLLLNIL